MRAARSLLVLVVGVSFTVAGCSGGSEEAVSPQDPVFAGLPDSVVAEVLASPVARERVAGDDPETAKARYQGMVRNFIACRAALGVYQGWLRTGTPPAFPAQPAPTNPVSWASDMDRDIARFRAQAASGDISLLRTELTNGSGCGSWIPARPNDVSGPTIANVVSGKA